mmetsp:Transcript_29034/g.76130  ORF Transcript_29034/g.76130 Transcript_29034/m.76130 type:complete len:184 (+) Transcript_29034:968-1519(+)
MSMAHAPISASSKQNDEERAHRRRRLAADIACAVLVAELWGFASTSGYQRKEEIYVTAGTCRVMGGRGEERGSGLHRIPACQPFGAFPSAACCPFRFPASAPLSPPLLVDPSAEPKSVRAGSHKWLRQFPTSPPPGPCPTASLKSITFEHKYMDCSAACRPPKGGGWNRGGRPGHPIVVLMSH